MAKTKVWWIKNNKLGVAYWDDVENKIATINEDDKQIRVHLSRRPITLSAMSDIPEIPSRFHDGLVARVIEKLSVKSGNMAPIQYWRSEWDQAVMRGKKYVNKSRDGSSYAIKQVDY
jgi:hypothetical protein|tara:strand:- start:275 stop:625 length:351 start_codon:yes stop_codon:yes gene_type:complete